ncbi:hypothetical protein BDZ94DRAFT_1270689 [Collybia nuda]|uniref:DUF6535 domain-containing protein n=1 Tax=Collybia nuda TaxID=64659 RepID=A0A9P5XWM6_9AGAR|nr:hypothetical protein BDZ94DRAFT_1270689 [Collybia nuda]
MEDWIKAMEESNNGMCKGWRDQIDTLVIFAGLFSATVTAFTIESYQWLSETPTDTLARLQLRALLNATLDPAAVDSLAPAKFSVSPSSVWINTLWFASLAFALTAAVVSILCKQWLYEYQRYENVTTEDSFLIHGLCYRGLQTWRVPEIITSLPILLQIALVLFLSGILVLLWSFQSVVASITTVIVGLTFPFSLQRQSCQLFNISTQNLTHSVLTSRGSSGRFSSFPVPGCLTPVCSPIGKPLIVGK